MGTTVYELVYEEARRGLDLQRASLDALHTRAGTLLAAAALTTTFLGGQALRDSGGPTCLEWLAIAAFVGVAVLTILVLLPWKFQWALPASDLVNNYVDADPQPETNEVLRDFALFHGESKIDNKTTLETLQWCFRIAAVLLGCEVVLWLIAV